VLNEDGKPARDATVALSPRFAWEYSGFSARPNAEGRFSIEGLRQGAYQVNIFGRGRSNNDQRSLQQAIEIAGDTELDFVLEPRNFRR